VDLSEAKKPPGDGIERAEMGVLSEEPLRKSVVGIVKPRLGREICCISALASVTETSTLLVTSTGEFPSCCKVSMA
jgi:hypothetical protein